MQLLETSGEWRDNEPNVRIWRTEIPREQKIAILRKLFVEQYLLIEV